MFRLSIRSLLAKKLRFVTTALAIVLGVAFTAGTMILADTMSASFATTIEQVSDGVDVVVRGARLDPDDPFSPRLPVADDALSQVAAEPGIATAAPYWEGYAQVIGADGAALDVMQSAGLNWIDDPDLSMFRLVGGRAPAAGEVVLGDHTAELADVEIGDPVDLLTTTGRSTFTVVGLSELQGGGSFGNTAFVQFHDSDAALHLGEPGTVDWVVARADGAVSLPDIVARLGVERSGDEVITGDQLVAEEQHDVDRAVDLIETILLVFGFIALFVGSFTIANTFTITIAQRTKELALVRAIGASRRQVFGSVVVEAAVLGLVAAGLGLAAGIGVADGLISLFSALGLDFPDQTLVVETSTVVTALVAGVGVTVVSSLLPARRGATVAPVDAMRDATLERVDGSRRRAAVGAVITTLAVAALAGGAAVGRISIVGTGALAAFVGVITIGPVLVRPVTSALSAPMRRLGAIGRLAAANADRNPKRSAATASALTIGVMLVAGTSMFAATASATVRGDVTDVVTADRVIRPIGANPGIPTDVVTTVDSIAGVDAVPMQMTVAGVDGVSETVGGLDLPAATNVLDVDLLAGSFRIDTLAVGDRIADERGWDLGDVVTLTFPDGELGSYPIGAIVRQTTALPSVIAPYLAISRHGTGLDRAVLVDAPPTAIDTIEAAVAATPTATVETADEYAASLAGALDVLLTLVLGFLGLAVVIAVLGIATTIGLSVHERTRELGVLRAVGMSRRQLRRSIRLEAIVIALFGNVLGLALGVGCTWAALTTLGDAGFVDPVVPVGTLAAITVGALVAGVAAAALPARRAARLDVLDAVRTD